MRWGYLDSVHRSSGYVDERYWAGGRSVYIKRDGGRDRKGVLDTVEF